MRTLVIDSATPACSVALFDGDHCIAGTYEVLGRGHAERLVPMIAALPSRGRADRIAVARGPGSFTGVRVGIAAARALAYAWSVPIVGYQTLALVAAMALHDMGETGAENGIAVAMIAGHGEWFVQRFSGDGIARDEVASLAPEAALAALPHETIAGSAAQAAITLRGLGIALPLLPDARAFALLGTQLSSDVSPLYGRGPDAMIAEARA